MAIRDFKEESLRHFDRIAHRYDSHHYSLQTRRVHKVVRRIVDDLKPSSLLDVGCGNGGFLALIDTKNCKLAGADLSPEMIKYARERLGETVDLRVADSEHLPWEANTFDCLTCNFSFHHYPNPAAVLEEIHRVLKPGGHLVISDPWFPRFFLYMANLAVRFSKLGDVRMYSLDELRSFLTAAGFNIERLDHRSGSSYSVCRKMPG
jgi:ubiquinone/menaquinone biosynthesis C-methylase UbiE